MAMPDLPESVQANFLPPAPSGTHSVVPLRNVEAYGKACYAAGKADRSIEVGDLIIFENGAFGKIQNVSEKEVEIKISKIYDNQPYMTFCKQTPISFLYEYLKVTKARLYKKIEFTNEPK